MGLAGAESDRAVIVLPGLGHLVFWGPPDAFVDEVTHFLLSAGAAVRGGHGSPDREAGGGG